MSTGTTQGQRLPGLQTLQALRRAIGICKPALLKKKAFEVRHVEAGFRGHDGSCFARVESLKADWA
eukprot:2810942-Rhodomonas_salina.3